MVDDTKPENPLVTGQPHIIVLGNEKGGAGKSTTAMHIVTALLHMGLPVGVMDLDGRQSTLIRYIENRERHMEAYSLTLPMPACEIVVRSARDERRSAELDEKARFEEAYYALAKENAVIVIDCPGSDTQLSRMAHMSADTLVTPVNDSLVDLDLLALYDPESGKIERHSHYADMVFEQMKYRMMADGTKIDWVVTRNRISPSHSHNHARVGDALEAISKTLRFRPIRGLGERMIYRELFLKGLTLSDLRSEGVRSDKSLTMGHIAARQELRTMIEALNLPVVKQLEAMREAV